MQLSGHYFGLTGGIACGKSAVAGFLKQLGAEIIDADKIGHALLRPSSPVYAELVEAFGAELVDDSGEIDRGRLGPLVFARPEKLRRLNAILHPHIIKRVEQAAEDYYRTHPHHVIVVDAALIFEAGIGGRFRKLIVAWCRPEQQIGRLVTESGLSREEAQRRVASQMSAEEKRLRADFVIDCSGSMEETRRQVAEIYPKLVELARSE